MSVDLLRIVSESCDDKNSVSHSRICLAEAYFLEAPEFNMDLYLGCRQENKPYMLIDFSDSLQTNVYEFRPVSF